MEPSLVPKRGHKVPRPVLKLLNSGDIIGQTPAIETTEMTSTVKTLLDTKAQDLWWISPEDTVYSAIQQMAEHNIGALMVLEDGELVGILSERDYTRKVILEDRASKDTAVADIMTGDVVTVQPHQSLEDCLALMDQHRIRHLPVVREGKPVGMLSTRDVLGAVLAERTQELRTLEGYIQGY
jgi:signal-transduction protein with cAMP-binding, CBS, and nucleotidyltransferase domain